MTNNLSAQEFEKLLKANQLNLCLIGMSNVGKTYWSQKLAAEMGFSHINVDDLIEAELGEELTVLGYSGINDMSKWLGQPYDERFDANQQRYLDHEIEHMRSIIAKHEQSPKGDYMVIDTTGSVVHTTANVRQRLKKFSTVVYIEASPEMQREMFELYIAEPKPVVWGDIFKPAKGENNQQALARCYPELLNYRSGLYKEMAHVVIPRDASLKLENAAAFLEYVKNSL